MFGKLHFHILWLDGVCEERTASNGESLAPRLRRTRAPTSAQLTQLADTIARRVCRNLAKRGWLEGEEDSAFLKTPSRQTMLFPKIQFPISNWYHSQKGTLSGDR